MYHISIIYTCTCISLIGLLGVFCRTLLDNLSRLPGDGRTMVGFLTYDHALHFYNLKVQEIYLHIHVHVHVLYMYMYMYIYDDVFDTC